ncbi:MAG TPA: hypothetical protein PLJ35_08740 [Anaerolineae bacterium]|nr:hypothetical protein [Anaerolineae bacterium]HPL29272.1 hypothetical protein [Anaerolineae bacterium]
MSVYNFIILLSPSILVIAALVFVATMRYISYREQLALLEHGADIDEVLRNQRTGRQGNRGILWAGTITATSGLGLLAGLLMLGPGLWLTAGFLPLFVGLGMLGIYYVTMGSAAAAHDKPAAPAGDEPAPGEQRPA